MGPVFRGNDPATAGPVVVKVLRVGLPPERVAIVTSALAAMRERLAPHPALCPMLDNGVHEAEPFVVSAFVDGDSLDVALREYGPANISDALPRLRALADALDSAATAGIVHGSLHLRDIMVSPERTVLTGIGVGSALERVGVRPPVRRPYCAPEIAQGLGVSPAGDQFALAAIAHEWLSGRRIAGPGAEGFHLPGASAAGTEAVAAVFCRALDELPDARYPTASAFVDALEEVADALAPRVKTARRRRPPAEEPRLAFEGREDPPIGRDRRRPSPPTLGEPASAESADREPDDDGLSDQSRLSMGSVDTSDDDPIATVSLLRDDPGTAADGAEPDDAVAALEFARAAFDDGPPPAGATRFDEEGPVPDVDTTPDLAPEVPAPDPSPPADVTAPAGPAAAAAAATPIEPAAADRLHRPRLLERPSEPPRGFGTVDVPLPDDSSGAAADDTDRDEPSRSSSPAGWAAMILLMTALAVGGGLALARWGTPARDPAPQAASVEAPATTAPVPPATGAAPKAPAPPPPPASAPPSRPAAAAPVESPARPAASAAAPRPAPPAAKTPAKAPAKAPVKAPAAETAAKSVAASGRLLVRSSPSGAEVFVNGDRRGVTPLTLRDLAPGAYAVRVSRAGYAPSEQRITLDARRPSRVLEVALTRASTPAAASPAAAAPPVAAPPAAATTPGSLLVESRPPGARVLVDGREAGTTPMTLPALPAGDHTVRIELAGYQTITTTTRVEPGARARVAVSLTVERQQ